MGIYLLQTVVLGLIGGLLGVALGVGVQLVFPYLIERLVHLEVTLHVQPVTVITGLLAGGSDNAAVHVAALAGHP